LRQGRLAREILLDAEGVTVVLEITFAQRGKYSVKLENIVHYASDLSSGPEHCAQTVSSARIAT
jgi:hypothetical protein